MFVVSVRFPPPLTRDKKLVRQNALHNTAVAINNVAPFGRSRPDRGIGAKCDVAGTINGGKKYGAQTGSSSGRRLR